MKKCTGNFNPELLKYTTAQFNNLLQILIKKLYTYITASQTVSKILTQNLWKDKYFISKNKNYINKFSEHRTDMWKEVFCYYNVHICKHYVYLKLYIKNIKTNVYNKNAS